MRNNIFLFAVCFSFFLFSSSKPIDNKTDIKKIEILDKNYETNNSNNQCAPSWRWIGDNFCNINVRVDNPCNQTAYFYIVLNNCSGPNCVRTYYVNPGAYIVQPIQWCAGGTFYWGRP